MSIIKIYTLTDPTNNKLYYVGASVQMDNKIVSRHLTWSYRNPSTKKLSLKGKRPLLDIIDTASTIEEAAILEEYWFYQLKSWGFELENELKKDGGFWHYRGNCNPKTKRETPFDNIRKSSIK